MKRDRVTQCWVQGILTFVVTGQCASLPPAPPPIETAAPPPVVMDSGEPSSPFPETYDSGSTALRLEVSGVFNRILSLVLHGTESGANYQIESTGALTDEWMPRMALTGANSSNSTGFELTINPESTALFLRARPAPTSTEENLPLEDLQLWLVAEIGKVQMDPNGAVSLWKDQSGRGNDGFQTSAYFQPQYIRDAVHGRDIIRFVPNSYLRFPDFLSQNSEGEVFILVRTATNLPASNRALWRFGQANGGFYPSHAGSGGYVSAGFGRTSIIRDTGAPRQRIDDFHLYNAATEPGRWVSRINGLTHHETSISTVGFSPAPCLGYNGAATYLDGDVAEIMLFNRVLVAEERDAVGRYLNRKFQWVTASPAPPEDLAAAAVGPNQVSLSWTHVAIPHQTTFILERTESSTDLFAVVAEIRDSSACLDTTVEAGSEYRYRLKARNHAGASAYSAIATAITPATGARLPTESLQLWLKADAGVVSVGTNLTVSYWRDQSGRGNDATQTATGAQPRFIVEPQHARPRIRFDGLNDFLHLPDFLSTNLQGEVFVVLRTGTSAPPGNRGLWHFGAAPAGYYPATADAGGYISASFGRSAVIMNSGTPAHALEDIHFYNVTSVPGNWVSRINGFLHYASTNNAVAFTTTPALGRNRSSNYPDYFEGDIAELMVFDRALAPGEREAVGYYLNRRYAAIDIPSGAITLRAQTLSSSQVVLAWTPSRATNHALQTYVIERREGSNDVFTGVAHVSGETRWLDEEALPDTSYAYRARPGFAPAIDASNVATTTTLTSGAPMPLDRIALWLRADDLLLSTAEAVSEWGDFWNPNRAATQNDPAWQPRYRVDPASGHAAVHFEGGSFVELPPLLSNATQAEVFVVIRPETNAPSANRGLWRFNDAGPTWFPDTHGRVQDAFGSTVPRESQPPLPDLNQNLIYNVSVAADRWQARVNGPLRQRLLTNTVHFAGMQLLGRSTDEPLEGFEGEIAELIVFNRILTGAERSTVRNALILKYDVPLDLPRIPAGLALSRTNRDQHLVCWTAQAGSGNGLNSALIVERQTDLGGVFLPIASLSGHEACWLDSSGLAEIDYRYRLKAVNDAGTALGPILSAERPDMDGDGLEDAVEELLGTAPGDSDTDGDGLMDGWEIHYGLNPLRIDGIHGGSGDFDGDGLSNLAEYQNGSDPSDGVTGDDPTIQLIVHRPR